MKATQKKLLDQYLELSQKPTLKVISEETGLQMTRVFRLLNGSAMRLSEYEIFHHLVQRKLGLETGLPVLAEQCLQKLSAESLKEIEGMIKRKLALWDLKQKSKNFLAQQTVL